MFTTQPNLSLKEARLRFEKDYIKAALHAHGCNLRKTAEALDLGIAAVKRHWNKVH